jgi:hypothetical protein
MHDPQILRACHSVTRVALLIRPHPQRTEKRHDDRSQGQPRRKFEGVFETLRDELLDHLKGENMPDEAVEWFRRVRPHLPLVQDRRG